LPTNRGEQKGSRYLRAIYQKEAAFNGFRMTLFKRWRDGGRWAQGLIQKQKVNGALRGDGAGTFLGELYFPRKVVTTRMGTHYG